MPHVTGCTFNEFLQTRGGKLPEPEARLFFSQLLSALEHLHQNKLSCPGLSPARILVNQELKLKILPCTDEANPPSKLLSPIQKSNYLPASAFSHFTKARSEDIFAAGALLFHMVTGREHPALRHDGREVQAAIEISAAASMSGLS